MKHGRFLTHAATVAALVGLAACSDTALSPPTPQLLSDALVTNDVVVSSADAIASDVSQMVANEVFAGMAPRAAFDLFGDPPTVNVTRSRTCYDANNQPQAQCDMNTTASIVFMMTMDGSFSRTSSGPEGTDSMTVYLHRTRNTTISGLLGQETSRTHNGVGTAHDTTSFAGVHESRTLRRTMIENALDSIVNVVFNLPHASNPWPASGRIVRYVNGTMTLQVNDSTFTRSFDRRIEVTFPPDNQANVTLTVTFNGTTKTCLLNLVTRRVTGCQ